MKDSESNWVAGIARHLTSDNIPAGELSALRRMDPTEPRVLGITATEKVLFAIGASPAEEDYRRWVLITHCLALSRGNHDTAASTGRTLAVNQYSEARLYRLLSADFDLTRVLMPRLARLLAAKNVSINWLPLAQVMRWVDRQPTRCDNARLKIARDYARASATMEKRNG